MLKCRVVYKLRQNLFWNAETNDRIAVKLTASLPANSPNLSAKGDGKLLRTDFPVADPRKLLVEDLRLRRVALLARHRSGC